ncbi:hypothetical protein ALC56_09430, partial [Trachymyrmex septentrionalis]
PELNGDPAALPTGFFAYTACAKAYTAGRRGLSYLSYLERC